MTWDRCAGALLAKMIGEFSYEELLTPKASGAEYELVLETGPVYAFMAERGVYGSWFVDPASIRRDGVPYGDPLGFIADAHHDLGISGETAGHLVRELAATMAADARIAATASTAAEIADLPYAELEGHQTGHPWIVFNKGRLGFSANDSRVYPPEARRPMRLPWIAVHEDLATFSAVPGLSAESLYRDELDSATRARFGAEMVRRGLDPARYWWFPVHSWQWDETIEPLYGTEIAAGLVVPLGEGDDEYAAQQSIRTFTNLSRPDRRHVKLPLSILNTMVWRGLPTERTLAAPAVTAWLQGIADNDPFLRDETRLILLGEVASVAVGHPTLDRIPGVPYQYRELLGAIWREPLTPRLDPGERARTLASLLHADQAGRPFVAELISRSGLEPAAWFERLVKAIVPPLVHVLYRYGTAFSPHGENAIVVFDEHDVPVRLAIKDFVDDVNIADVPLPELANLPEQVCAVLLREPPDYLCQFIHSALFVGHFRYLSHLAARHLGVPEARFWALVRGEIDRYQARFPYQADRYGIFDLFTAKIDRLCLNRNRLLLDGYRDRPDRPHVAPHGQVDNPLSS